MDDLKRIQDELDIMAYDIILENDEYHEDIETIYEYAAVSDFGEKLKLYIPDLW